MSFRTLDRGVNRALVGRAGPGGYKSVAREDTHSRRPGQLSQVRLNCKLLLRTDYNSAYRLVPLGSRAEAGVPGPTQVVGVMYHFNLFAF